jgi:hypothetical protein
LAGAELGFRPTKLSVYEGIGHAPFYDDAPRFNRELTAFVREATKGS